MNSRRTGSWEYHSDSYSLRDICVFEEMLPELLSKAARDTSFARKEHIDMMDRFKRSFGGAPLFSKVDSEE